MQYDIHQAALPLLGNGRQSGQRARIELAIANDPQTAFALGDEHAPIREERHAPRVLQTLNDDAYAQGMFLAAHGLDVRCGGTQ
jgi:hypothetical protein